MNLRINHVPGVFPDKWFSRWRERYNTPLQAQGFVHDQNVEALLDGVDAALVRVARPQPGERPNWFPHGPGIAIEHPGDKYHFIPLYTEQAAVIFGKDHKFSTWPPDQQVPASKLAHTVEDGTAMLDWQDYPESVGGADMGVTVIATGAFAGVVPLSLVRAHNHPDVRTRNLDTGEDILWQTGLLWCRDQEEHPLLQDFIGVLRGRSATSSRQPSVREKQQRNKRLRKR